METVVVTAEQHQRVTFTGVNFAMNSDGDLLIHRSERIVAIFPQGHWRYVHNDEVQT